jgi:hypothetical protein
LVLEQLHEQLVVSVLVLQQLEPELQQELVRQELV